MDANRLKIESQILQQYFPKRHAFVDIDTQKAYVDVGIQTNSKNVYRLRVKIPKDYPNSVPDVLVSHPTGLKTQQGRLLSELGATHDMHILGSENGMIRICHFKSSDWIPTQTTIYKVILKARVWLEGYEWHLRTGLPIDRFVKS